MKKIISLFLIVSLVSILMVGCVPEDKTSARVGVLNGPTGMGLAKMISDYKDSDKSSFEFECYASPDLAIPALTKGELDMLCLPTNTAATLSGKLDISVIAINCLGSLYLVSDSDTEIKSINDLNGKTVYASVPNSTTGPILNHIFDESGIDVDIEFMPDHDSLVAKVVTSEVSIAVLPEPKASSALMKNSAYSVDLNISNEWAKISSEPLTMGCIVVRNDFLEEHPSVVKTFLDECEGSINYVNSKENIESAVSMITAAGIIPAAPLATKAINNLYGSLVFISGNEMKDALVSFYNAIGQALPSDDFYYVG